MMNDEQGGLTGSRHVAAPAEALAAAAEELAALEAELQAIPDQMQEALADLDGQRHADLAERRRVLRSLIDAGLVKVQRARIAKIESDLARIHAETEQANTNVVHSEALLRNAVEECRRLTVLRDMHRGDLIARTAIASDLVAALRVERARLDRLLGAELPEEAPNTCATLPADIGRGAADVLAHGLFSGRAQSTTRDGASLLDPSTVGRGGTR